MLDGKSGIAQVAGAGQGKLLLLLSRRHRESGAENTPFSPKEVIAARIVDASALSDGQWTVAGYGAVPHIPGLPAWPPEPDTPADDPAVIEAFLNACLGLFPWDGFGDPDFFANMLLTPTLRPVKARLAREMDHSE